MANIKLDGNANPMTPTQIIDAFENIIPARTDTEEKITPFTKQPLSTESLNQELKELLLARDEALNTLTKLIIILSPLGSFSNFDERTWALLHLACRDNQPPITAFVYSWLLAHPDDAEKAMQARLFLLSQDCFDMDAAGYDIIAEPIIKSNDAWALLALLASPSFDLQRYKDDSTLMASLKEKIFVIAQTQQDNAYTQMNSEEAKSDLWTFVRYSGIGSIEKTALLENIVTLLQESKLLERFQLQDIITLTKISSKSNQLSSTTIKFLSEVALILIQNWSFDITPEEEESFQKPERKFIALIDKIKARQQQTSEKEIQQIIFDDFRQDWSIIRNIGVKIINPQMDPWLSTTTDKQKLLNEIAQVWEIIETDLDDVLQKVYRNSVNKSKKGIENGKAESVLRQLLNFIATPGMLDPIIALDTNKKIQQKINDALNITHDVFFSSVFSGLWNKNSDVRSCGNEAVEWLFGLDAVKELRFLSHQNYPKYLKDIFESHDEYFISKLSELEKAMSLLFEAISQMDFNPNNTNSGIRAAAKYAILHPKFDISRAYPSASATFQELTESITALHLQTIIYSVDSNEISSLSKIAPDDEILINELTERHKDYLKALVDAFNTDETNEEFIALADVKITKIFKLIKQTRAEKQKEFYGSNDFIDFLLSYRIKTLPKMKVLATEKHKEKNINFLEAVRSILKSGFVHEGWSITQLSYIACKDPAAKQCFDALYSAKPEQIDAVKGPLLQFLKKYPTPADIQDINVWLKKHYIMAESLGKDDPFKTKETLSLLPNDIFKYIFEGTKFEDRNSADLSRESIAESSSSPNDSTRVSESGFYGSENRLTISTTLNQKKFSLSGFLPGNK
jgi:hypothetical protein